MVGAIQAEHGETGNLGVAVKERFSLTSREDITEGRICKRMDERMNEAPERLRGLNIGA